MSEDKIYTLGEFMLTLADIFGKLNLVFNIDGEGVLISVAPKL